MQYAHQARLSTMSELRKRGVHPARSFDGDIAHLLAALCAKPRNQACLPITNQVKQQLESALEGGTDPLASLRVVRKFDGWEQSDSCKLVQLDPPDSRPAIEYINYGDGYETPDDVLWDPLED